MSDTDEIGVRAIVSADEAAIKRLHAQVFGPGRFARSAYRVREGTPFASPFCRVAVLGEQIIASLRMTPAKIGGKPGVLLLGPLAVDTAFANKGYGRRIVEDSFEAATVAGYKLVLLVGDLPYYSRMGFIAVPPGQIQFPGPANPARILVRELVLGALGDFRGLVTAAD